MTRMVVKFCTTNAEETPQRDFFRRVRLQEKYLLACASDEKVVPDSLSFAAEVAKRRRTTIKYTRVIHIHIRTYIYVTLYMYMPYTRIPIARCVPYT